MTHYKLNRFYVFIERRNLLALAVIERHLPKASRWQLDYLAPGCVPCSRVRTPSRARAGVYRCLYTVLAALAAAPRGSDTPRRPPPPLGAGHGGYARTGSDE